MSISLFLSIILTITHITSDTVNVVAREMSVGVRNQYDPVLGVGVCYGQLGDNLPSPWNVTDIFYKYNLKKVLIYRPDWATLNALTNTPFEVTIGTHYNDVEALAHSPTKAQSWFLEQIRPHLFNIGPKYIIVGNNDKRHPISVILTAMRNLQTVVDTFVHPKVPNPSIKVTTMVDMDVLRNIHPPSNATFVDPGMIDIIDFLKVHETELLVNVHPYYVYAENPKGVRLDYTVFNATDVVVQDGALGYKNMFDAMVDSFYWAMEKVGAPEVGLIVSESGWPHGGGDPYEVEGPVVTSPEMAAFYNKRLVQHLESRCGTPKRPNVYLQGFLRTMFDQNFYPPGVEQNWGILNPSAVPYYNPFVF